MPSFLFLFKFETVVVDDYIIPAGTSLVSSMERMHENPEVYEDPKKFNPERYLNNTKTMFASANGNIKERDHYNFGWGRRICPGMYLVGRCYSIYTIYILIIILFYINFRLKLKFLAAL